MLEALEHVLGGGETLKNGELYRISVSDKKFRGAREVKVLAVWTGGYGDGRLEDKTILRIPCPEFMDQKLGIKSKRGVVFYVKVARKVKK